MWKLDNDAAVVLAVITGKAFQVQDYPEVPECIWSILCRCWAMDPNDRPTMQEVYDLLVATESLA